MRFPDSIEELNAAWFSAALARNYPGTEVTSLTHGTIIRGTATKVRTLLDYNDAGHAHRLPPSLWYKGGLEAHSSGEQMMSVYAAESLFYRDLAPGLDLTLPKSHFVAYDEQSGRSAMLLEDMLAHNARFGHATRPASPKLAASVLTQLAKLHSFRDVKLKGMQVLAEGTIRLAAFVREYNLSKAYWARALTLPRGRLVEGELADRDLMDAIMQKMLAEDRARAESIVHGDLHLGNVCILPGDNAAFVDWQAVMLGFWAHDVAYFLTGALTVEDRRAHERALIDHYAAEVQRAGGSLDAATAWWEYRRHALYGLCWFPCPPEWAPEEVSYANTERVVAALKDLDTIACWQQS